MCIESKPGELDDLIARAIEKQAVDMTRTVYWIDSQYTAEVQRTLREMRREMWQYPNE